MTLPDPSDYTDGMQFFRDTHKLVLRMCADLEPLLIDAEQNGVFPSFAAKPEWNDIFEFFLKAAPQHERDEEQFLFPLVIRKVPRVGFQQPEAPIHFLVEGHDVLQQEIVRLVKDWDAFRKKERDPKTLADHRSEHAAEDAAFIALGRELVSLYRDHVAVEEERVYSVADKVLTGTERLALIDAVREADGSEGTMPIMSFEPPQFSDPDYNIIPEHPENSTEAISGASFEPDEDEEIEEE